jgi:tetratricopeptide (TPR) repeat protein
LTRLLLFVALLAPQPGRDIYQRLREAPLPSSQGESLANALRQRDFAVIDKALAAAAVTATLPDRAELFALQGAVDFIGKNMQSAAAAFLAAEKISPLHDADNFTLAMAEIELQNGKDATFRLQSLADKHPTSGLYLYWLARIDYDERRYDEAIAKLNRVIELDPQSVRAYDSLGLAYDMQGQPEPARLALEKASSLNRNQTEASPWPPHDLGYLLLRMNRFSEAESALRESLRYEPNFAQAHYHLGRVLEKEEQLPAAVLEYERAITLDAASPEPCYSLALLYRKLKRDADATKMFAEYRRRKGE